jgi:hypothetical protein
MMEEKLGSGASAPQKEDEAKATVPKLGSGALAPQKRRRVFIFSTCYIWCIYSM